MIYDDIVLFLLIWSNIDWYSTDDYWWLLMIYDDCFHSVLMTGDSQWYMTNYDYILWLPTDLFSGSSPYLWNSRTWDLSDISGCHSSHRVALQPGHSAKINTAGAWIRGASIHRDQYSALWTHHQICHWCCLVQNLQPESFTTQHGTAKVWEESCNVMQRILDHFTLCADLFILFPGEQCPRPSMDIYVYLWSKDSWKSRQRGIPCISVYLFQQKLGQLYRAVRFSRPKLFGLQNPRRRSREWRKHRSQQLDLFTESPVPPSFRAPIFLSQFKEWRWNLVAQHWRWTATDELRTNGTGPRRAWTGTGPRKACITNWAETHITAFQQKG